MDEPILVGKKIYFKDDIEEVSASFGIPCSNEDLKNLDTITFKSKLFEFPIAVVMYEGVHIALEASTRTFDSKMKRAIWKFKNRPLIYIAGTLYHKEVGYKYYVRYFKNYPHTIKLSRFKYLLQWFCNQPLVSKMIPMLPKYIYNNPIVLLIRPEWKPFQESDGKQNIFRSFEKHDPVSN